MWLPLRLQWWQKGSRQPPARCRWASYSRKKGWPWPPFFYHRLLPVAPGSAQAMDVLGNLLHVLVAQAFSDGVHDHDVAVMGGIAVAEVGQLLGSVGRMLAGQTRIASRLVTLTGGGMAAGAGRQTGLQIAAAVDGFATLGQFCIGHAA